MNTPDTGAVSLADLIQRHRDQTGDSYATIARATGLSKALIGQLAQPGGRRRVLQEGTVEKLARGLRLPDSVVQSAAMVSAGLQPASAVTDQRIALLTAQIARLDAADLERVEVIVDALVRHRG